MIGVGELMEREVRHAHGLALEPKNVRELDGLRHFHGEVVFLQPSGAGMVAGSTVAIGRGGEVEGDFFKVSDRGGGDSVDNVLKLIAEEVDRALGFAWVIF